MTKKGAPEGAPPHTTGIERTATTYTKATTMKTLLSFFDYSGAWSRPFWDSGKWDVYNFDLKDGDDIRDLDSAEACFERWDTIDGILSAVPCTDFSVSGSQYWPAKDAAGTTAEALELLQISFQIVDLFRPTDPDFYDDGGSFFWALENPVGRLPSLVDVWPCADLDEQAGGPGGFYGWTDAPFRPQYFQPHEFAGHLNPSQDILDELDRIRKKGGADVTAAETEFVVDWNAYTKRTGLWGDFKFPTKRSIDPVRCCKQGSPLMRLGGKSDKTKELRSNTPEGFAQAFFEANGQ